MGADRPSVDPEAGRVAVTRGRGWSQGRTARGAGAPFAASSSVPGGSPTGSARDRATLATLWGRGAAALDPERVYGRRAPWVVEVGLATARRCWPRPAPPGVGLPRRGGAPPGVGRVACRPCGRGPRECPGRSTGRGRGPRAAGSRRERGPAAPLVPGPWPKRRHHKRRLVQPAFAGLVARVLRPGGCVHVATDWEDYARHILEVLEAEPRLVNAAGPGGFLEGRGERPASRFERRGFRLGHTVFDLLYRRRERSDGAPARSPRPGSLVPEAWSPLVAGGPAPPHPRPTIRGVGVSSQP